VIDPFLRRYHALLLPLAILAVLRVIGFAYLYSRDPVQTDFAAMYHAAASMRAGFDPYRNNVDDDLALWDGAASFRHSRFLYPPIVAYALQPIALLPYPAAKTLWTATSLLILAAATVIAIRAVGLHLDRPRWLFTIIVIALLFPLLPLLERGQIDQVTLLFISIGFYLIFARRRDLAGGAVIALAGFVKLQCFYLLPLLLIARRPRAAVGMAIAIAAIALLQLALCGVWFNRQYVFEELPRISRFGETGTDAMRIDSPTIRAVNAKVPPGDVIASGKFQYHYTVLPNYAALASLVPYVRGVFNLAHLRLPSPVISFPLLAAAVALASYVLRRGVADDDGYGRLAIVAASMIIVMLIAPITWTTNLVWLAPIVPLMLFGPDLPNHRLVIAAAVVGLILLLLPDPLIYFLARGHLDALLGARYVAALLLLLPYALLIARHQPFPVRSAEATPASMAG